MALFVLQFGLTNIQREGVQMEILALVFTLLATLAIGVYEIYRKHLLNRRLFTEYEMRVGQCGIAAVLCVLFFLSAGGWWDTLAPQIRNPTMWWIALIATTAANVIIQFAGMRSARLLEASFRAPIAAMTPGFVVLTGAIIGEWPSTLGLAGIGLIVGGVYAHAREGAPLREYFVPLFFWLAFRSTGGKSEEEQRKVRGLRWAYAGALLGAVGLMGDGLVARHGDMILAVAIELGTLALVYAMLTRKNPTKDEGEFAPFLERFRRGWRRMIWLGILFAVPFILLGIGFRLAPIAYIGSLKRLYIIVVVLGGMWLLRESSGVRRTLLACIVVAGSMLIAFDPTPAVVLDSLDAYLKHIVSR